MMPKFSFLQKILSPAVSAGKITDFIIKYDGEFIQLDYFNQLNRELSKNLTQFKSNILKYNMIDSLSHISVFNYKGNEFNCLIFSIDISEKEPNILNVNIPFLAVLQVGKNIYFSRFGHLNDTISFNHIKQIVNIGISNNLFHTDSQVKFLTDRILESFAFKPHPTQIIYKVEHIIEDVSNYPNAENNGEIVLANDEYFSLKLQTKAFGFSFLKLDVEITKKELNDGKRFVSNDYFVEVNNNLLSRDPVASSSITIWKCDNGMSDINYNNYIGIDIDADSLLSGWNNYYYTYVTTSERQISRLVRKHREIMENYLNIKLQTTMTTNVNIDDILEIVKEQGNTLQNFKLRNQALLVEELSKYQEVEVV